MSRRITVQLSIAEATLVTTLLHDAQDDGSYYGHRESYYGRLNRVIKKISDELDADSTKDPLDSPSVTSRQGRGADTPCPECGGEGQVVRGGEGKPPGTICTMYYAPCPRCCSTEGE